MRRSPSLLLLLLASCSTETPIGSDDAGPPPRPTDECGNGFDDDGDGRIDEDPCVCGAGETQPCWTGERGSERLGACAAGRQRCSATGSQEFGGWGACEDAVVPDTEACEGSVDEDCDGAVDEGCECEEEGAIRSCLGSAEGACSAGNQRCNGGAWTACENAVRPVAEECGDGVDNDCDGTVDDPSFCDCTPVPEVCGDGADNDCDGTVDEEACREPGAADAGVDAGTCVPSTETCDGRDEDCDGVVDDGACSGCACDRWAGRSGGLTLGARPDSNVRHRAVEAAIDGEDTVALLYPVEEIAVDTEIVLELHRVDGSTIATRSLATVASIPGEIFASTQNANAGTVAFGDGRFVATWSEGLVEPGRGVVKAAAVGRDGALVAGPVVVAGSDARIGGVATSGADTYVVFFRDRATYAQRLDRALAPMGSPIAIPGIGDPIPIFGIEVRTLDDAVAVIGTGTPGTTARIALLRAGRLAGSTDLGSLSTRENQPHRASAATDGSGEALVCYQLDLWTISCRRIALADASPRGAAFPVAEVLGPGEVVSRAWDVVAAGCAYQLTLGVATGSGSQSAFRSYEIDAADTVRVYAMDRQWVQSNQTFAAFRTHAGGLLRVLEDKLVTLQSCAPALPEPDCAILLADATDRACGACSGDTSYCRYVTGAGMGSGRSRDAFTPPFSCETIDAVACRLALDAPTQCAGDAWLIPADCALRP